MAERDARGLFQPGNKISKGNKGGPGRPPRPVEEEYLRAISDAISPEDWRAATMALLEKAKAGDTKAFEVLSRYVAPPESRSRVTVSDERSERQDTLEDALRGYGDVLGVEAPPTNGTATS